MESLIKQYFKNNNFFQNIDYLRKKLKITGEEQIENFHFTLRKLVEEGYLFFDSKNGYRLFTNDLGFVCGEIEITKSGNGYLNTKDGYKIFIPCSDLNGALNGDIVILGNIDYGKHNELIGKVEKILKRKSGNIIFEVIGDGVNASFIPYDKNEYVSININKNQLKNLVDGELILVNIGTEREEGFYFAEILETIGHKDDPNIDLKLIYKKYNVPIEFSDAVQREVENINKEVFEFEIEDRVDLREKEIITIDCDETKDRDDAILVERLENGNFKLYVNISHVSHYVSRNSKLFEEALVRCTSYYPNNTCNPLFPHKLSNGICSLNPNVDRLTRTCEMEINSRGEVVNYDIYLSVINSKKAMKYSEVNSVLKGEQILGYDKYVEQLNLMKELSDILDNARKYRNYIDFDIADIEIMKDDVGCIKGFAAKGQGEAEKIIENFMLITGTTIAEHYSWMPFIYRVHEAPNPETVKEAIKVLKLSGISIPRFNNIDEKTINYIIKSLKNPEVGRIVRTILLKAMKKARYDINSIGHFALQLKKYCHFTSPIRRVSDFMVHTLIDEIETFDYSEDKILELEQQLSRICENASYKEKVSKMIESEALLMSMAEYMEKHIGDSYNATITEVYQHGMFVETDEFISGKIKFEDMLDDYYYYDDEKKAIIGKNTKKKFQIGNKILVIVKDACKESRTVNFSIGNKNIKIKTKKV